LILHPDELSVDCSHGEGKQGLELHQEQSVGESPSQVFSSWMNLLKENRFTLVVAANYP
jgi:hypothetical protein